jgi:hypothetical protein
LPECPCHVDPYSRCSHCSSSFPLVSPTPRPFAWPTWARRAGGVGGRRCDAEGQCSSAAEDLRRPAGGGYLGLGLAAKLSFFSPYVRVRQQLTGAQGLPMTSYTSVMPGLQFSILETVHLWAGTGYLVIATSEGRSNTELPFDTWLTYDVGLSLAFGGWRQAEAKQRWRERERRQARAR